MDHVAFAVWDLSKAAAFWGDLLEGQYRQGDPDWRGFAFVQFAYPGGGRVELLAPGSDESGFVVKFLRRFGEGLHHVTFVVGDLREQVERMRGAAHPVFGEDYSNPHWMEAFVSPGLVGSRALVQLAQSDLAVEESDQAWGGSRCGQVLEAAALRPT